MAKFRVHLESDESKDILMSAEAQFNPNTDFIEQFNQLCVKSLGIQQNKLWTYCLCIRESRVVVNKFELLEKFRPKELFVISYQKLVIEICGDLHSVADAGDEMAKE